MSLIIITDSLTQSFHVRQFLNFWNHSCKLMMHSFNKLIVLDVIWAPRSSTVCGLTADLYKRNRTSLVL